MRLGGPYTGEDLLTDRQRERLMVLLAPDHMCRPKQPEVSISGSSTPTATPTELAAVRFCRR